MQIFFFLLSQLSFTLFFSILIFIFCLTIILSLFPLHFKFSFHDSNNYIFLFSFQFKFFWILYPLSFPLSLSVQIFFSYSIHLPFHFSFQFKLSNGYHFLIPTQSFISPSFLFPASTFSLVFSTLFNFSFFIQIHTMFCDKFVRPASQLCFLLDYTPFYTTVIILHLFLTFLQKCREWIALCIQSMLESPLWRHMPANNTPQYS